MKRYLLVPFVVLLATLTTVVAQEDGENSGACPALVEEALTIVDESCSNLDRNIVCYGNGNIEASSVDAVSLDDFSSPGDQQDIADIYMLTTEAMDVEQDIWGIAVLALQANIPDTLPGQNVTFLLYGDAQITADADAEESYDAPLQAFRFTSGVGEPNCVEAPRDGLLVQSPEGVTVNFMVNGIEVALGSTVLIQADEDATNFTNIEGNVTVTADGVSQVLAVGETTTVETPDDVAQAPQAATSMDMQVLVSAPVTSLPQQVALPAPTTIELQWGVCFGDRTFNFPVGQVLIFYIAHGSGTAEMLQTFTATASLDGVPLPLWSRTPYAEIGWEYRYITGALEAGTYAVSMTFDYPAGEYNETRECSLIVG